MHECVGTFNCSYYTSVRTMFAIDTMATLNKTVCVMFDVDAELTVFLDILQYIHQLLTFHSSIVR